MINRYQNKFETDIKRSNKAIENTTIYITFYNNE